MFRQLTQLFRTKMLRRLFVTHLWILISCVFLASVVFLSLSVHEAREKNAQQAAQAIEAVNDFHEMITNNIEGIALSLQLSSLTSSLEDELPMVEDALRSIEYMGNLNNLQLTSPMISNIWVYDLAGGLVYTSFRTRYSASEEPYQSQLIIPQEAGWQSQSGRIAYVRPVRNASNAVRCVIMAHIDLEALYRQLLTVSGFDRILILNEEGCPIYGSAEGLDDQALSTLTDRLTGLGQERVSTKDGGYLVSALRGTYFTYVGMMNTQRETREVMTTSLYALSILLIFALIGTILCILMSKQVYNPIAVLIKDFEARKSGGASQTSLLVKDALNDVADSLPDNPMLSEDRAELYERVVHNEMTPGMRGRLENLRSYVVIMVEIDEPDHNADEARKLFPLFEQLVRNFLRRILLPGESTYTIFLHEGLVAAVVSLQSDERMAGVDELMRKLQAMLGSVNPSTISMACSMLHTGEEEISTALSQASQAIRQKMFRGLGSVIFYDADMEKPSGLVYPQAGLEKLFSALDSDEAQNLPAAYHAFIEELSQSGLSVDDVMLVLYQVLGHIFQTMVRQGITQNLIFTEPESSPYRYLSSYDTLEHMADWLQEKLMLLWRQRANAAPGGSAYINAFKKYMDEHYMDRLSPETVAATLNISYSYLRKLLNTELGCSFSSYLLKLRMQHTRRLLATTDLAQREIAVQVGFGNEQTLYRVFKQHEGISPGEFRKKHS